MTKRLKASSPDAAQLERERKARDLLSFLEPREARARITPPRKAAAADAATARAKRLRRARKIEGVLDRAREPQPQPEYDAEREADLRDALRCFVSSARAWLPQADEKSQEALFALLAQVYRGGATPREFSQAVAMVRLATIEQWWWHRPAT